MAVRCKIPYSDLEQLSEDELKERMDSKDTLEFGHSLDDFI